MRLLLAVLLLGCATEPVVTPTTIVTRHLACLPSNEGESRVHLLARILVQACSAELADEVSVAHAELLLGGCHKSAEACMRHVCKRFGESGEDDVFRKVAGR